MAEAPHLTPAAIAGNRFGLGIRADEPVPPEPKAWLLGQFQTYQARPSAWANQASSVTLSRDLADRQTALRDAASSSDKDALRKTYGQQVRETYRAAVNARVAAALTTPAPFVERLVYFWSNHFAVSVEKPAVAMLAGSFEAEAIRPHVLGRFEDMLLAVERHPAMQVFLDQVRSVGPDSMAAEKAAQRGEAQALAVLHDLATAPATAQHVADKLARHFVADTPPPALVEKLAEAFQRSGGDLPSVYRVLIEAPEAWAPVASKFKTPWDWTLSSLRGLNRSEIGELQAAPLLTQLGQTVWKPGSPAGYDDLAASWAAPDALVRRVEVAQRFASKVGDSLDARTLGPLLLANSLSEPTASAVSHAESASTALALLLVSPDFQRR